MADVRPFRALRPRPELAQRVAAPPYDVVDTAEARALAAGNPDSFLHVSRPEIDLPPHTDPHADTVHAAGRAALEALVTRGVLTQDDVASYYVYRQRRGTHTQTGVVGCAAVADYTSGVIRTHEHTRPDKEDDRVRHIDALDAHDEPVFLLAAPGDPSWAGIETVLARVTAQAPVYDLVADDGIGHVLWTVDDPADTVALAAGFAAVHTLYVADGHHRSAAAARVCALRGGTPESDAFLAVVFPGEELAVLPYHRVVADLAGHTPAELVAALGTDFEVRPVGAAFDPPDRHTFGMYCDGAWYRLRVSPDVIADDADVIAGLGVSVLQNHVLAPLLGIDDPRTDKRIGFVGGIRGTTELERLVDSGAWAVAFALHPTSVAELVTVAATGQVMPPKSTWFEPKLRSGLFVHRLQELHS